MAEIPEGTLLRGNFQFQNSPVQYLKTNIQN